MTARYRETARSLRAWFRGARWRSESSLWRSPRWPSASSLARRAPLRQHAKVAAVPSPLTRYHPLWGPAPDFDLPDAAGKRWSLHALRERPVLVSFWATWCPPCVEEMPSLETLARRLGDRATVLAVSVDDSWDAIRGFFPRGTALTILLDPTREVPARFGTSKFPESFLIDRNGHVRYAFINQRDWSLPEAAACIEDIR
jgi:peroxiredoxin